MISNEMEKRKEKLSSWMLDYVYPCYAFGLMVMKLNWTKVNELFGLLNNGVNGVINDTKIRMIWAHEWMVDFGQLVWPKSQQMTKVIYEFCEYTCINKTWFKAPWLMNESKWYQTWINQSFLIIWIIWM